MAINDKTNPETTASSFGSAAPAGQANVPGARWSFHQRDLLNSPISAGIGGEYFIKIRTALAEIYKDITEGLSVTTLALNRQNFPGLKFSALVIACRMPEVANDVVAYHTLILEGTGEKLSPVMKQVDNQNIQIRLVTSDACDAELTKMAFDAVNNEFRGSKVYSADAMVIPAYINDTRKDIIESIARNAAMACVSVINQASGNFGELNLVNMDPDCRFLVDVSFGNHQVPDVVGRPQRSSVTVAFSSQKKSLITNNDITVVNVPNATTRICDLSGFLNPIWAPTSQQNGFGFGAVVNPNMPRTTQSFAAEFVITAVRTEFATSPAAVLLAISSFLALVDNDAWVQAFLPRGTGGYRGSQDKIDITDIGALNITANVGGENDKGGFGSAVDIAALGGDLTELSKYIVSIFRPGVVVSLDCPEAGPASWYLSVFASAASGDMNSYNQIFQAAQELTNDGFERYFPHGTPMFTNIVRVPMGSYKSGDTEQDIRNIDYTAIANRFANDPTIIHEYSNTFVERPGVSAMRNLAIREGIIADAVNQNLTIDGYAARVSFSDPFVKALSQAIADCKLPVQVNTPLNVDQLRSTTPTPGFIGNSLVQGTHTFASGIQAPRPAQQYRYANGMRNY